MKIAFYSLLISVVLLSCNTNNVKDINPDSFLSKTEQSDFKYSIIRWAGKPAPKVTDSTLFDPQFEEYYKKLADQHELAAYYIDEPSGYHYFMMYRIAPSIHLKKVALAGRLKYNDTGDIVYYEEVFRTFKMLVPELEEKSKQIFNDYLSNGSIEKYLFKNTTPEEFIEFPDDEVRYDTNLRKWISSRFNPVEELKNEISESLKENNK